LLTLAPVAGWVAGALGLVLGTKVKPFQVPLLFSLIVLPLTFLGCTYFPWQDLQKVEWLKWVVLANPVVYMTEGFRAALVGGIPHMPLYAIYGALIGFGVLFTWIGVTGFENRVVT
ncbi:MAG: ABC transporter permease, partial [Ilumatobacteraceae bacterium]